MKARLLPWIFLFFLVSYGFSFFLNAFEGGFCAPLHPVRSGRKTTIGVVIDTINIPKRIYQKETNKGQRDSRIRSYRKMKLIPIQSTSFFPSWFEFQIFQQTNQSNFQQKKKGGKFNTGIISSFFTEKKKMDLKFIPIQPQSESLQPLRTRMACVLRPPCRRVAKAEPVLTVGAWGKLGLLGGGGFKDFGIFTPKLGEDEPPIWLILILFKGVGWNHQVG